MNTNNFLKFFNSYKKGTYTRIEKATTKNGYTKRTAMVCRFVNYYHIKSVKQANKQPTPKDYERTILPHILKENTNTNNILLLVYTTKNKRQKAKTSYFYNGEEITAAQYYEGIKEKPKTTAPECVMTFKLCDVLSVGGIQ